MAFRSQVVAGVVAVLLSLCGLVLRLQQRPVEDLQRVSTQLAVPHLQRVTTTQLSVPYQAKDWSHTGEGRCGEKCMEAWKARVFHLASMDDSQKVAQKALGKRISSARRGASSHSVYACGVRSPCGEFQGCCALLTTNTMGQVLVRSEGNNNWLHLKRDSTC